MTVNAKQRMLAAAAQAAERRGYEALRIREITDPVGVSRQAFYAHFRDKRHCLAEVIDTRLAGIERLAAAARAEQPAWAAQVMHAVDEAIGERFGSPDGTRGRLIAAIGELLRESGSLHRVRIGALVKRAHVPQGDFYRQFSGKRECFALAYEGMLEELFGEVRFECPAEHSARGGSTPRGSAGPRRSVAAVLSSLGTALAADPIRLRLLLTEASHLPARDDDELADAWRGSLAARVAELLAGCEGVNPHDPRIPFTAASVVEVIRSTGASAEAEQLPARLEALTAVLPLPSTAADRAEPLVPAASS